MIEFNSIIAYEFFDVYDSHITAVIIGGGRHPCVMNTMPAAL